MRRKSRHPAWMREPAGRSDSADLRKVLPVLENVEQYGHDWSARCPVCGADNAFDFLKISLNEQGKLILWCYGGCLPTDVARAIRELLKKGAAA